MSHLQEMLFYQINPQSQVSIFILKSHQLFSSKQVPLNAPAQTLMSCNIPWSNFLICQNLLPILPPLFQRATFPTSNKPHFPSIHEPMSPKKPRKPVLNLPLRSVCFLLQHLPLTTFVHALYLNPSPRHITHISRCRNFCSFAAAKAKAMFPSSLQGRCSLPQPCFSSPWAAADWPSSLLWVQDIYTQLYHHTRWEQEDSSFHQQQKLY